MIMYVIRICEKNKKKVTNNRIYGFGNVHNSLLADQIWDHFFLVSLLVSVKHGRSEII